MHEDIEFDDGPVNQGIAYNDLGRVESYVLTFAGYTLEVTRLGKGILLDNGVGMVTIPLPIIEAMMRLDLASMAPMATEAKEEE